MTSSPPEDLTDSEIAMVRSAATGEMLDLGQGSNADQQEASNVWGVIRSAVLRQLLTDERWPAQSVRLSGARISGRLDMTSSVVRCPLYMRECIFDDPITLDYATASALTLTRCRLSGGLSGENLSVTESLDLSQSILGGALVLRRAQISGRLDCGGAHLAASALSLYALYAERVSVGDDVLFDEGFVATGPLRLNEARIAGQLVCSSALLSGIDGNGCSLSAAHIIVESDVFFDQGFNAQGSLRLNDAAIAGQLVCTSARLRQADSSGYSLFAERISVGGNVFLDDGFAAAGTVSFSFASLGRSLRIIPESFTEAHDSTAFDGSSMNVAGTLLWAPSKPVQGAVSLEGATTGELEDHWTAERPNAYWPTGGLLHMNGFVYNRIVGTNQATVRERLAWIRGQYAWTLGGGSSQKARRHPIATQPYSQLERVYRAAGQDRQATSVAIAMRRDIRRHADIALIGRAGNWLMDYTVRYGYQPWRALASLATVYVSVVIVALIAQRYNAAIVPIPQNAVGISGALSAGKCTSSYPCFNAAGYAFDTVVPVINLHEADYWRANPATTWGLILWLFSIIGAIYGWLLALLAGGGSARVLAVLGGAPPPGQDSSRS